MTPADKGIAAVREDDRHRFQRGDLVEMLFDEGGGRQHGPQITYGVVLAAGPATYRVQWESGLTNRVVQGFRSVSRARLPDEAQRALKGRAEVETSPRKHASYREGVEWIALNDDNGSPDALQTEVVASYISTSLLADLFGIERERVALDVVRYRKQS